ncbi:hypothetical protein MCP_2167 [Methanocella paludicola SANAE]|uniref:Uncharacterized protein n=1 Tax=Methanocella paludicola (strain DSM 17711 / JCM 13418 / NBRC 101707 / SANAE) TaxID=304371 RepID=D1Z0L7_METPS|nr:hypothetical protein [Methanocella paludicola]BAI62239.1 hypothetical protein MCP_2167 [Methanocella paludicola SANAE]
MAEFDRDLNEIKKIKNKPIKVTDEPEIESYRLQVRISPADLKRLQKLSEETCTSMSMWGSIFIHDGLDDREAKKKDKKL